MRGKIPTALLLSLDNYNSEIDNGQSLRVETLRHILESAGWSVNKYQVSRFRPVKVLRIVSRIKPDIVVGSSFALAPALLLLNAQKYPIWFDVMDSAKISRLNNNLFKKCYYLFLEKFAILVILRRSRIVTYISQIDSTNDIRVKDKNVYLIPNIVRSSEHQVYIRSTAKRLVIVGDLGYRPNKVAAKYLLSIKHQLDIELVVYGKAKYWLSRKLSSTYVQDNSDLYRVGDIHICLSLNPAGIKNKVVNSLVRGLPVLTTAAGMTGIKPSLGLKLLKSPTPSALELNTQISRLELKNYSSLWNGFLDDQTPLIVSHLKHFR